MYTGTLVFSQVMDYLPLHISRRYVARYDGERYVKRFRCLDQYLVMAFAQLTYRASCNAMVAPLGTAIVTASHRAKRTYANTSRGIATPTTIKRSAIM